MPRNPARSNAAKNKADRLFSLYIRGRDKRCLDCGTSQNLQCAHIFSRRYLATRWDPRNAVALCVRCHKRYTHDPLRWEDWCRRRMDGAYESLRSDALDINKAKGLDFREVVVELQDLMRKEGIPAR